MTRSIQSNDNRAYDNRGAAMIVLSLLLFLVLSFIAFFIFDMNRMQMAQRQLNALCDSSSLAGTAMLTGQDLSYGTSSQATTKQLYTDQINAMQYAQNSFCMGNILGAQLYDSQASGSTGTIPVTNVSSLSSLNSVGAGAVSVYIQPCCPLNNYAVVSPGSTNGRAIFVQAAYGYTPLLSTLGIPSITMPAQSTASLQKLLITMVFDCSGSMDDSTVVTFVNRTWTNNSTNKISKVGNPYNNQYQGQYNYQIVTNTVGSTGQLWEYSGLDYTNEENGTAVNVLPPQNLTWLGYVYNGAAYTVQNSASDFDLASPPLIFDMAMRAYIPWPGQANTSVTNTSYPTTHPASSGGLVVSLGNYPGPLYDNDFGTPPGNCPVKYGYLQSVAPWISSSTVAWDGNSAHGWGPGYSAGFLYYGNAGTGSITTSSTSDGYTYFYDPYSIPSAFSGTASNSKTYSAFTDLVANITPVTYPQTQPLYGSPTFSSCSQPFSSGTFTVGIGEQYSNTTVSISYETDSQLAGKTFNFKSLAYVVEASRGNLDFDNNSLPTNYVNALLSYGNSNGVTQPAQSDCAVGWQKAYQRLAMYCSQPYATAVDGAYRFFQNLLQIADSSMGLYSFSVAPASFSGGSGGANPNGSVVQGTTYKDLWLACSSPTTIGCYSTFYWQSVQGLNPNFWFWYPTISASDAAVGTAGPVGSPTGIPYSASGSNKQTSGPSETTWVTMKSINSSSCPANASSSTYSNNLCGFTNWGYQMPRYGGAGNYESSSSTVSTLNNEFYQTCGSGWSVYNYNAAGNSNGGGYHGLFHTRPLYDTDSLEALESAITNVNSGNNIGAGQKKVIVFFTDGIPTDDTSGTYSLYSTNVVVPAVSDGIAIYAIGLSLNPNSSFQQNQGTFLSLLANNGTNGSQLFQVLSANGLISTFTGISRQLTQAQR